MQYKDITIPKELDEIRRFWATVYSLSSKNIYSLFVELDEEDEKIIDFSCTCKGVSIPKSMGKQPTHCKHIKHYIKLIKEIGYMK